MQIFYGYPVEFPAYTLVIEVADTLSYGSLHLDLEDSVVT